MINVYIVIFLSFQESNRDEKYLIIKKPRNIEVVKSEYIYTIWEFAAEFGGWVGILFGYCALDIFKLFTNSLVFLLRKYKK